MEAVKFRAHCAAQVSSNGANFVLIKFEPDDSHLQGKIAKALGELEQGESYDVTFVKVKKGD
jgi:hypothetical protein